MKPRVLICDNEASKYGKLRRYLEGEGFEVCRRVETEADARSLLELATKQREYFHFVMLDIELGQGRPSGIDVYFRLAPDFPGESYIIYSSADVETFRNDLNRLLYRDVQLVLLDEILSKSIHFYLNRLIRKVDPRTVFFVHGRHRSKNARMRKLLSEGFGLELVEWEDAKDRVAGMGLIYDIVLKGIEMSNATVVLFTDEETAELAKSFRRAGDGGPRRQARPNVYIEAGYAVGVRPNRTILLEWPRSWNAYESPSDFSGMHTIRYYDDDAGRDVLRHRLESARCILNLRGDWRDFDL